MLPILLCLNLSLAPDQLPPLSDLDRFPSDRACSDLREATSHQLREAQTRAFFASQSEADAWAFHVEDLKEQVGLWDALIWAVELRRRLDEWGHLGSVSRHDPATGRLLTAEETVRAELADLRDRIGWANYQAGHCGPRRP